MAVEGGEEDDAGEHPLANRCVNHICCEHATKRASKEVDWSALLVNLILLACLENEHPLVIVDLLMRIEDSFFTARVPMTAHIHAKDFVASSG